MYQKELLDWFEKNQKRLQDDGILLKLNPSDDGALHLHVGVGATKGELTLSPEGQLTLEATGPTPRHPAPAPEKRLFSSEEMLDDAGETQEAIHAFVDTLSMLRPQTGCLGGQCS